MSFVIDKNELILLKNKGFDVFPKQPIKKMTLKEINNNLFPFLESNERVGFFFIKYPDELIRIENNKEIFDCFGKCKLGYFGIDAHKKIYLLVVGENDIFNQYSLVFVNSSLENFIKIYSLFIACIFLLRSEWDYELENYSTKLGSNVDEVILNIIHKMLSVENEINNENNFWHHIISSIENLDIKLNLPLVNYCLDGRCD
ncbi:hypothetical protein [Neisseria dumasiana]|uniref:Uncharacterized protein n=1 Tax=Neisseria dumasiana TaxID=1931275 RepID=A0A1X3D2V6_9NEIS|nr:hypothetical protein [Neisseria dumasiana]OSI14102.1 hypothetical protein BV912_12720 [Neisseria dumasiana]